jgi:hypothetical protein
MRNYGYTSPLLGNPAADCSARAREGLVAPILFPRIPVGKPGGKYAVFEAEDAFKAPDAALAGERSRAGEFNPSGVMTPCAASRYALKSFIDEGELQFMDGPFKLREKRKAEMLVTKLERVPTPRCGVGNGVLRFAQNSGSNCRIAAIAHRREERVP